MCMHGRANHFMWNKTAVYTPIASPRLALFTDSVVLSASSYLDQLGFFR